MLKQKLATKRSARYFIMQLMISEHCFVYVYLSIVLDSVFNIYCNKKLLTDHP